MAMKMVCGASNFDSHTLKQKDSEFRAKDQVIEQQSNQMTDKSDDEVIGAISKLKQRLLLKREKYISRSRSGQTTKQKDSEIRAKDQVIKQQSSQMTHESDDQLIIR